MTEILSDNLDNKNIKIKHTQYLSIINNYKIPNVVHMTFCTTNLPLHK